MSPKKNREVIKTDVCKVLNKIGALKFGAFKLTSGKMSPYYIDLRVVPSFPDAFEKICKHQADFIKEEIGLRNLERIAAIPIAGIPFASLIAYELKKPFLYVRKGEKLHGRKRRIEGALTPGDRVLLVDDLITTGLSLRSAVKAVESEGGVAKNAVVLLDREEGGREKLKKDGIELHSLLKISEIANKLHDLGAIDQDQLETILRQIKLQ